MKRVLIALLAVILCTHAHTADHLVLVTIDGLRWQEVFSGYDPELIQHDKYTENKARLIEQFGGKSAREKRQKLLPFIWGTIEKHGVLAGNRDKESQANVTNNWWFSYPGYNEILTGRADPNINSNEAIPNANITFLEWLQTKPRFKKNIAAFGSWGVFSAIINRERSGIFVNAGLEPAIWPQVSVRARFLNDLQGQLPVFWEDVRPDDFTYGLAKEYLIQKKPKVLYIALGETDDFAHDEQYLQSAHRSDTILADLWNTLQTLEGYRDNTNLLVTVDHGRGNTAETWPHHASGPALTQYFGKKDHPHQEGIPGSNEIWIAALGPDIKHIGEASGGATLYQSQVAATALRLLGFTPSDFDKYAGPAIASILNNQKVQ
ncbi:alkaline phosphatase family protein [uncultured Microbulbifer sp.]|uniref:alkaline phosphatase family protein n=1 Tax=uncultured Microbulbifer sp. TaxID=348147 RepID=UPI0026018EAB|nr:alkaline phosphatase family protein [uncultured Microbulbifer sp.]